MAVENKANDKMLLIQRGNAPRRGEWGLPDGVVELGETIQANSPSDSEGLPTPFSPAGSKVRSMIDDHYASNMGVG